MDRWYSPAQKPSAKRSAGVATSVRMRVDAHLVTAPLWRST
ncbi:hypothetical protein [Streptomyces albidocamelliae]|uniref:Uncharacterized protein n=1 Tax=Streptomyces albidocamelliae TaxID=2981135 RepID=A0ABY6F1E8_9ACTN|nr:hypothetical protein [Streptomyces sp. HUAS 14-6]UXY40501.1 hypothetical protein N8I86_38725 [Streptomyces sp. HUAS 14-6]